MRVIFTILILLVFLSSISEAVTIGGAGNNNEILVLGNLTVMDTATVADLVAIEEFMTVQISIDGTTTIPLTSLYIAVESNGGDVIVTANPRIASGAESGDTLILIGTSDSNKLIFENGNGLSMSISVTVGLGDVLAFKWDEISNLWEMLYSGTK